MGLPSSLINFCYKHIYKEISKYKRDFSGGHKCKSTIRCDIGTTQCNNRTMRKKLREPLNVTKDLSNVMLVLPNVTMKPSNMRKKIRESPNVTK